MGTYLAYHGILGPKLGIRRYQDEDGTLTEAGKKRVRSLEGKKESQRLRYDKASKKYVSEVEKHGSAAANLRSKASKMRYDATYSLIGSKKSREKKLAKADKLIANTTKYKGLMDKAQAKIAKYDRKISEIATSKVSAGYYYVDKLLKEL